MKRILKIGILTGVVGITNLFAQIGGNGTYAFLKVPATARIEGLGGNIISLYDNDLSIVNSNPANLNADMNNQVVMSFNNYFANIGQGYFAYSKTWKKIGSFYAGFQFLNYGDFQRTDEFGNLQGTFSAGDYAFNVGYSRPFFDSLMYVGATVKMIGSQYAEYNSFGLTTDLGVSYVSRNKLTTVSFVMRNMGGTLDPYEKGHYEAAPFEMHVGFSQGFKHVPLKLFVTFTNLQRPDLSYVNPDTRFQADPLTGDTLDTKIGAGLVLLRHFTIGAELFPFKKHLFLRVAYNFLRSGEMTVSALNGAVGLSYGIGIRISHFTFSYSRSQYFVNESPNHFTLNINLDGFFKSKKVKKDNVPTIQ